MIRLAMAVLGAVMLVLLFLVAILYRIYDALHDWRFSREMSKRYGGGEDRHV